MRSATNGCVSAAARRSCILNKVGVTRDSALDNVARGRHLAAAGVEADGGLHQGGLQHGLHLASTSRGRGGRAAECEDEQESRGRGHGAGHCRTPGQGSSYRQQAYIVCKHGHGLHVNALLDVANWEFVTTFRVQRLGHQ